MKIKTKFLVFTVALALLFAAIRVRDRVISADKLLTERTATRTAYIASFLSDLSGDYLSRGHKTQLIEVLSAVKNLKQVARFRLVDAKGNEVYRMTTQSLGRDKVQLAGDVATAEDETYDLKTEIRQDGKYLGYIEIAVTLEGIKASVENLMWRSIFHNLASTLALLILMIWLSDRLGRGMESLHHLAGNVQSETLPAAPLDEMEPDISDIAATLRRLHSDLRSEAKKRKELEELKNDFFAMTVQDMKQPVASLKGSLDMLLPEEERRQHSEKVLLELAYIAQASVARLNTMVGDLLTVAKLTGSEFPLNKEHIALDDFLAKCAEENSASVAAAGKKWLFAPPADENKNSRIYADPDIISRVIGNLVQNAIQYTPTGGHIVMGANLAPGDDKVEVYVRDDGAGIPENYRKEMFQKFKTLSTNGKNLGLGLAFCKMAADRHGAVMTVKSELGKGTEISFLIPVSREDAAEK